MGCIKSRPMKARITPPSSPYYVPFHRIDGQLKDHQRELAIYQMELEDGFFIDSCSPSTRNLAVRSWITDSHPADVEQRIARLTLLRTLVVDMAHLSVRIRQKRGAMPMKRERHHSSFPDLTSFGDADDDGYENSALTMSSLPLV